MRKYYSPSGLQAKSGTQALNREITPWEVLGAFVQGAASTLGFQDVSTVMSAIKRQSVARILELSADLDSRLKVYDDEPTELVRAQRQLACLLKKFPFVSSDLPVSPRDKAMQNLLAAEEQCKESNDRIRATAQLPPWVHIARRLIGDVLGELEPSLIMQILSDGTHGPGATLSSEGNRTTPYYKTMDVPYTCTKSAYPYACAAMSLNPRWLDLLESRGTRKSIPPLGCPQYQKELTLFSSCVEIVSHDKITFVPKDAKTDRPIAVGASLNMYLQLAIKNYMQRQLKKFGVDLTDQKRNQDMAYAGSRYAFCNGVPNPLQYSTIDLSSASDTISYEIVKLLLDPLWFSFLCDIRHESGDVNGQIISYQKFSAMGNGFTFPLESLIFWAIAKATILLERGSCANRDIAVYGDDIIVRENMALAVISSLEWAGFRVNTDKSFVSGYFKESCGSDYYRGYNVRPFYLKRRIETYEDIYFVCNSIADLCMESRSSAGLSGLYTYLLGQIPHASRRIAPLESSSDFSLRVPLNCVASFTGSRPYLSPQEFHRLQLASVISNTEVYCSNAAYAWSEECRAISYKGSERARLFISLTEHVVDTQFMTERDKVLYDKSLGTKITRRNAIKQVITVRAYPNWDGHRTRNQLLRHPASWC